MSKWRKPLKNKRRFDARYFLNETIEGREDVVENSVQQEKLKRDFHDFSFDSWSTESVVNEGADEGTPGWSKPTKDDESDPIDYDHDDGEEKIGGKVVEEGETTIVGKEEEEENYGEPPEELQDKEIEDAELEESLADRYDPRHPDYEDPHTPGGRVRTSKMQRAKRERELDAERKRDAAAKTKRGKQSDDAKAAWKAHMAKNES